jgi:transcription elongation factor GreA
MQEYITKEQLKETKKELEELKGVKMKEIAEQIRYAASFGDLSENFAYHDAKEKQQFLLGKIIDLTNKIRNAKVVEKPKGDKVQIGSIVQIDFDNEKQTIEIMTSGQSNPLEGKVSYESPLGKALLNKSKGDKFKVDINGNKVDCKILDVN